MSVPQEWVKNSLTRMEVTRLQQAWNNQVSSISKKIWMNFETQKTLIIENEFNVDAKKGNPYKRRELIYALHRKTRENLQGIPKLVIFDENGKTPIRKGRRSQTRGRERGKAFIRRGGRQSRFGRKGRRQGHKARGKRRFNNNRK